MADKEREKPVFIRTAYNYDMDHASNESGLGNFEKTRTQQHFKEESDINTIVRRFGVTGQMPVAPRMPSYGDYDNVTDFKTAMDAWARAREDFDALPAQIRKRFDHDPQKLLEFVQDDKNRPEAEKLGLVPKRPEKLPEPPQGQTPPQTPAPAAGAAAGPSGASAGQGRGGVT